MGCKSIYIFIVLLLIASVSWANNSPDSNSIVDECVGCHTAKRTIVEGLYPTGFHRWKDSQCYGCHAEIVEIAKNRAAGRQDPRQTALPVREQRLNAMAAEYPLPYLNAKIKPLQKYEAYRVDIESLLRFLKRPYGQCNADICRAPHMMAYPTITKHDISLIFDLPDGNLNSNAIQIDTEYSSLKMEALFQSKCSACHNSSKFSGYDPVGLSLFSSDWIYNYANGKVGEIQKRAMPIVNISRDEAGLLSLYFMSRRRNSEIKVDKKFDEVEDCFSRISTKRSLPDSTNTYIWSRFWRDAGCVHCHAIEGRAKQKFETTDKGLRDWLNKNDAKKIYLRLAIKKYEAEYGMSAKSPGMPMTGSPLPPSLINIIGVWIKEGCKDLSGKSVCQAKQE